jgi:hypothetical protein
MKLHMFTSSKGGVGKTLCAMCTAITSLERHNVLCIDLNWENPDLSRMLRLGISPERGDKFAFAKIPGQDGLILTPTIPFTIVNGAIGVWTSIDDAIQESKIEHNFFPDVVIVDTGLHFANLIKRTSPNTTQRVLNKINALAKQHEIESLKIWFIWTLASMFGNEHVPYIQSTLILFKEGLEGHFFETANSFINVLNPYALYPEAGYLEVLRNQIGALDKGFSSMEKLPFTMQLANLPTVTNSIELDEFIRDVVKKFEMSTGKKPAKRKDLFDSLAKIILERYDNQRPRNIFPIPLYDSKVVGLTDSFAKDNPTTLQKIGENVSSITPFIRKYIENL